MVDQVIETFLDNHDFAEIQKFAPNEADWKALKTFQNILEVRIDVVLNSESKYLLQIPHAFQHLLGQEKTPTLCLAVPAFHAMTKRWEMQQDEYPEMDDVIQKGIDKLRQYCNLTDDTPAYALAMSESVDCCLAVPTNERFLVLDPATKLSWFEDYLPDHIEDAKHDFIEAVCKPKPP